MDRLTWLHDGSGLLVINNKIQSGRLGFIGYPKGELETFATESGGYQDISLTSNDQTMAAVVANDNYHLYALPASGAMTEAKPLPGLQDASDVSSSQIGQSPDGKLLTFLGAPQVEGDRYRLQIVLQSTDGSPSPEPIDADPRFALEDRPWAGFLRFVPDGKAYAYGIFENSVGNIWIQPLDGSAPRALTNFTSEEIRDFNWSADGKQLAIARGHTDSDVVLLRAAGQD